MKKKRTHPRKRRAPSRKASSVPPPRTTIIVPPQHPSETPQSVVHLGAASLTVSNPALLAPALRQNEKPVVIENDQIAQDFLRLLHWKERRIAFVATLIALVLSMAIANKYNLEFSWYWKWKVEEIGGKITLTPSSEIKQRGTDDPRDGD
jgi:hypothetical protein